MERDYDDGDNYDWMHDGFNPLEIQQYSHKSNVGSSANPRPKLQGSSLQSKSSAVFSNSSDALAGTPRKLSNERNLELEDEDVAEGEISAI